MLIVESCRNVPIRLTDERWLHVITQHPEMKKLRDKVIDALAEPDYVQEGDFGALLAIRRIDGGKFLVVVYKEMSKSDGFVLTCYITRRPALRRPVIWRQR